jgi:hypothetical protein
MDLSKIVDEMLTNNNYPANNWNTFHQIQS